MTTGQKVQNFDRVEVRPSTLADDISGEGLFAKVDLFRGEVVALLNGTRAYAQEKDENFDYR